MLNALLRNRAALRAGISGARAHPDRRGGAPAAAPRAHAARLSRRAARPLHAGHRRRRRSAAPPVSRRPAARAPPATNSRHFYPMKKILVTGSIAYDTIMVFPDRFKNHLLADQLHILNVCFLTPEMRREFGGTAGNIGYNLKLLGEEPLVMATVGEDIEPYLQRFAGARHRHAACSSASPGQFTAQAFITTDLDDNQITAFHPGAMNHSHENHVAREPRRGPRDHRSRRQGGHAAARAASAPRPACRSCSTPARACRCSPARRSTSSCSTPTTSRSTTTKARCSRRRPAASSRTSRSGVKALVCTLGAKGSLIFAGGQAPRSAERRGRGGGRPDRLRRRLPRGAALRHRARLGLADDRQARLGDGRDQDRAARRAEPPAVARRHRSALPHAPSAIRPGRAER